MGNREKLRQKRDDNIRAIEMKFKESKQRDETALFCFFEGKDDKKYYVPKIYSYSSYTTVDKLSFFICKGKERLLKVHDKLKNEKVNMAYFIDSDYDYKKYDSPIIYQTPCHSIENFYTSVSAFKRMLSIEFDISPDTEDYQKCVKDYSDRLLEFHEKTECFNLWISYQTNVNNSKLNLKNIKLKKDLFDSITIEEVKEHSEINCQLLQQKFPEVEKVTEKELENFSSAQCNFEKRYRGKYDIEFLESIIESLKNITGKNHQNLKYFTEEYDCPKLNQVHVNIMSNLESYSDVPEDLIKFLGQY